MGTSFNSKQGVLIWALPVLAILPILRTVFFKKRYPSSKVTANNLQLAAPHCPSTSSSSPTWDVFLSFYGKDTRTNFTSHLYSALDQEGIRTFIDDHALEKGQEISSSLLDAIRNSNMFIVVLSENYARSRWCLDELAEIISCKRTETLVVPVFFYVDPSDVRHQKGSFGKALQSHKKRHPVELIEKWRAALSEIANLSGHHLREEPNEKESEIIQKIVGDVAPQASTKVLHMEKNLFGIDSVVEKIYKKLNVESSAVRAIGICGMGGIGKTTIAKAFFNKYFNKFEISCFSVNVKKHSQGGSSLLQLLQQLLIDLLRKTDYKIPDVESEIRKLTKILHSKKALIVLDDFDCANYSKLLESIGNLFAAGSKIIITTRDANLLNKLKAYISEVDTYMVKTLGEIESLKLFSYHAFREQVPPASFRELSLSFVTYAGGLPLALKELGSSLLGRPYEFWSDKLEKVKEISENKIQQVLQMSYDELDDETEKAIFLDIAFFFVGKDKDDAVQVLKSCEFFPYVGIPILVDRCLLTIDAYNKFEMHNLIQDMGKQLGRSTRLFLRVNAWKNLQNLEGRNDIEGLILDLTTFTCGEMTFLFERMPNLRLLQIIGTPHIKGNFKNIFPNLRCIRWPSCPWTHMPSTFPPPSLVSIEMPSSKFKILWKGPMPVKKLHNLVCLDVSLCSGLKQLPEQLGDMKALKKIDARRTAIKKLPDSITHLEELAVLDLRSCEMLRKLPEKLGDMKGLKELQVSYSAIKQLPDSITQLKELLELNLQSCKKLRKIPEQIGNMKGLRRLNASFSAIEQFPDSFGSLFNLKRLELGGCKNLEGLLERLEMMQCLEYLDASNTAIEKVPDSVGFLSSLKSLNLSQCKKLKWNLPSIQKLTLHPGDTGEISLPDLVKNMNKLEKLNLRCNVRLCLPMILCFSSLKLLILTDEGQILPSEKPFSLSELSNLQHLILRNCTSLGSSLPELPLNLKLLRIYNHTSLEQLPDLSNLRELERLYIEGCTSLQSISLLPSHLRSLGVEECTSLQDVPDLSMLKELGQLRVTGCNNLKSISLKESSLQVGQHRPLEAHLPNREVAEWFDYKSSGHTVSFDIPPSFGSNFLDLALWVVYTLKHSKGYWTYMRAVITNDTEGITENYPIYVGTEVGETYSRVECINGEKLSMKSGNRIKVSISSLSYSDYKLKFPVGEVKVEMCGVHVIKDLIDPQL